MMAQPGRLEPHIRQVREHQWLGWPGGREMAVILDAAITGGQLTVVDAHARRGDATPVHVHSRDDEAFLLLDGAMTCWVGEQRSQVSPGGVVYLPREVPHAVRFDVASRALILSTPAGSQEGVFRAGGWDLSQPQPDGWPIPPDVFGRVAEQYGVTITGPPHGLDD